MADSGINQATSAFLAKASDISLATRRLGVTIPDPVLKKELIHAFWEMMSVVSAVEGVLSPEQRVELKKELQLALLPVLGRSKHFARSLLKPNGYAGDFVIVEWMYALEGSDCHDPFQISFVNMLDSVFQTIHSVVSIWERRKWISDLIQAEVRHAKNGSEVRLLDIACGSARYISDALLALGPEAAGSLRVTLCDQDPAALAYAQHLLSGKGAHVEAVCTPVMKLSSALNGRSFDVIVASGLFDYFSTPHTTQQITQLSKSLNSDGLMVFTNYTPEDESALVKEWVADWSLIFKDEEEIRTIMQKAGLAADLQYSKNRSLIMAEGRRS